MKLVMSRRKLGIVPKKSDGGEEGEEILNGRRKISEEFEEQGEIILLIVSLHILNVSKNCHPVICVTLMCLEILKSPILK